MSNKSGDFMVARKRCLPERVKRNFGVERALSGKGRGKHKSQRFNKGKKHRHKRKTLRRGQPKDHAHTWLPARGIKGPDRRAEAVAWAKKRREFREKAKKLGVLFNKEYLPWFGDSFRHWKTVQATLRLGRERSREEVVSTAVRDALSETFGRRIPGIESLYDEFRAETGKYGFEDFQQWAKKLMETFKVN